LTPGQWPIANGQKARVRLAAGLVFVFLIALAACTIKEDKQGNGKKIDIETPVGGVHVSNDADAQQTGIAVYPGARPEPSEGKDTGANVSMSSGFFGLKIAVAKFLTDDSPDKVAAFYKKELGKFGSVLECHTSEDPGNVVIHKHPKNQDAVTCGDQYEHSFVWKSGDEARHETLELKTGIEERQHVVAIKPRGSGTEFALVYVNAHGKDEAL
jgi:hypothetical protein